MNAPSYEKWIHLFHTKVNHPRSVEVLREINLGYLSTVYLVSVDGQYYAVKMYNARYNETNVLLTEQKHIMTARLSIPEVVPQVIFSSPSTKNEFHREILVMEKADGIPLNKEVFNEQVFEELIIVLKRLHGSSVTCSSVIDELERIDHCRKLILKFLKEEAIISQKRVSNHLDALRNYYLEKKEIFNQKTIVHGDLWWDNILVDNGRIKLIDWLESSEQDYCHDLAQLKIGTLNAVLDITESQRFFEKILNTYTETFEDETIFERVRFYLPLLYLEEAFYIPFKFFPWEIKYKEASETFRKRFIDYYNKSECAFKFRQEHGI
jgi:thiamine kinase-like enzyme